MNVTRFLRLFESYEDDEEEETEQKGWWLDPQGGLHELEDKDHHHRFAFRLMKQTAGQWDMDSAMTALFSKGWVRLALENHELWVEHAPKWRTTVTQDKAIKRICQDYNATRTQAGAFAQISAASRVPKTDPQSWIKKLDGD